MNTDKFIANLNKSNEKDIKYVSAHTGNPIKSGLDLTKNDIPWIVGSMIIFGLFVILALGG